MILQKCPFRVVIVDDDPSHNELLGSILRQAGYEVRSCENGSAALTEVARGCECVITDYQMPEMNGIELLRQLRGPDSPICIMLTGSQTGCMDQEAIEAGAAAVLRKPVHPIAILGLLNAIASGHWQAKQLPDPLPPGHDKQRTKNLETAAFWSRFR